MQRRPLLASARLASSLPIPQRPFGLSSEAGQDRMYALPTCACYETIGERQVTRSRRAQWLFAINVVEASAIGNFGGQTVFHPKAEIIRDGTGTDSHPLEKIMANAPRGNASTWCRP